MEIKTRMRVERATAVLSPFEVAQAVADFINKYQSGFRGWVVKPESVDIGDDGGAMVEMERLADSHADEKAGE